MGQNWVYLFWRMWENHSDRRASYTEVTEVWETSVTDLWGNTNNYSCIHVSMPSDRRGINRSAGVLVAGDSNRSDVSNQSDGHVSNRCCRRVSNRSEGQAINRSYRRASHQSDRSVWNCSCRHVSNHAVLATAVTNALSTTVKDTIATAVTYVLATAEIQ